MSEARFKLLVAGVDSDTRALVEAAVRRAFAGRGPGDWTVSLVRVGTKWSVTLDGKAPGPRHASFTADLGGLEAAIRAAVQDDAAGAPAAAHPKARDVEPASAAEVRLDGVCTDCGRGFVVVYEARAGEPRIPAAAACPHCWRVNHVEIGEWAATGRDYRVEKKA